MMKNEEMELYINYKTLSALPPEYLEAIKDEEELKKIKKSPNWYAQIHRPRIESSGFIFKKTMICWDGIAFGSYPQSKAVRLKKQIKDKLVEDANGDYIYKEETVDGSVMEKYRKVSRSYFKYQPIYWRVLSVRNGIALLFADVILDSMPYQKTLQKGETTWKKCSLRAWLNSEEDGFYGMAFSEEEKKAIVKKDDLVSLLDRSDLRERRGICEAYVKGKLLLDSTNEQNFSDYAQERRLSSLKKTYSEQTASSTAGWWLKSAQNTAALISEDGYVKSQDIVNTPIVMGVRPIVWVDLSKLDSNENIFARRNYKKLDRFI